MPLMIAPVGRKVRVTKIVADEKTRRHLNNLGVIIGAEIIPLFDSSGDLILGVKDGRLALGRDLARKIFVMEIV